MSDVRCTVAGMQLTHTRVIMTAMELIEADGVEAVSMPRLATELGCGLMALYHLVPSRHALLDAVADAVMSAVDVVSSPGASWADQLRSQARAFRAAASAHPRCALIAACRPVSSAPRARAAEKVLATLLAAGLRGQEAVRVMRVLTALSAGALLCEVGVAPGLDWRDADEPARPRLRAAEFPHVCELAAELRGQDPDGDFLFGLDLLIQSVAALCLAPATT